MKLIVTVNSLGQWFWHQQAANGRLVATSGEWFASKGNAMRAARRFGAARGVLPIVVEVPS